MNTVTNPTLNAAAALYAANPNAHTLLALNKAALPLLPQGAADSGPNTGRFMAFNDAKWIPVDEADAVLAAEFEEIRLTIDRRLSDDEVSQASGALGYALRTVLAGEDLSEPKVLRSYHAQQTILLYAYDASTSQRTAPDTELAFATAETFVQEGSPVRKTDRAGEGSRGTRLVEGIGKARIAFAIR